jgi:hypothetical protein
MTIQLQLGHTDDNSLIVFQAGEVRYSFPTPEVPRIVRSLRALCNGTARASDHDFRAFYVPPDDGHPDYRIGLASEPVVVLDEGKYKTPSLAYISSFAEAAIIADRLERLYRELRRAQH